MDRVAVFVDAGYLFAAGGELISGNKLPRGQLHLDRGAVLQLLTQHAEAISGLKILRIYWYDGTSSGPTPQQLALAYQPSVKLRLGFVNQQGQQKGVDSLIVTDMINLARNRAMADAVLLSGDEDIRVGVQQAQEFGIRVHLLGIPAVIDRSNQSSFLLQEADSVSDLSREQVESFLSLATASPVAPSTKPLVLPGTEPTESSIFSALEAIARKSALQFTIEERAAIILDTGGKSVPQEVDRQLLRKGAEVVGSDLSPEQKRHLRSTFLSICREDK